MALGFSYGGHSRNNCEAETASRHGEERNFAFLRALEKTGRRFEDAGRAALLAESLRDRGMPVRPLDVSLGSASALCADSPLAGF